MRTRGVALHLRSTLLIATLVLAAPVAAVAQIDSSEPPAQPTLRTFLPDLVDDTKRFPSNASAVSIAVGGILAAGLSPLDSKVNDWDSNSVSSAGQWIGNPFVLAGATLGTY